MGESCVSACSTTQVCDPTGLAVCFLHKGALLKLTQLFI